MSKVRETRHTTGFGGARQVRVRELLTPDAEAARKEEEHPILTSTPVPDETPVSDWRAVQFGEEI